MPKTCAAPGCNKNVWAKLYCRFHQYMRKDKKPKPIPKVAQRQKPINRMYAARAALFIATHPKCAIISPVCTRDAQHVHHTKGRIGEQLLKEQDWLPACDACNGYVEQHDAWARENGFKQSKFTPNAQECDATTAGQ